MSSTSGEASTRWTCCASRQRYGASRIENCGTNWPNCAAPSSTIWIAPLDAASMRSRDDPSWPAGKVWISTAPPVCSRTCLATRSIIATVGWFVGSTVAQRSVVAALAHRGMAPAATTVATAVATPAPMRLRRVQRIESLIRFLRCNAIGTVPVGHSPRMQGGNDTSTRRRVNRQPGGAPASCRRRSIRGAPATSRLRSRRSTGDEAWRSKPARRSLSRRSRSRRSSQPSIRETAVPSVCSRGSVSLKSRPPTTRTVTSSRMTVCSPCRVPRRSGRPPMTLPKH